MKLEELKRNWERLGEEDPMWAILSVPSLKGGKWDPVEFFATGVSDIETLLTTARALAIDIPRGAALDFGCGLGRLSQALSAHFRSVVGVDVSESMLRQARQLNRHPDVCRYHLNTREDLRDFASASIDFCITFLVLQHMKSVYARSYISEFCRVLAPNGVLAFQIPTRLRIHGPPGPVPAEQPSSNGEPSPAPAALDAAPIIEMYATPLHDVVRLLNDNGLEVIAARSDGRAGPEFLSHEIWAVKV
jgi:SAM-dependent methyltransferase